MTDILNVVKALVKRIRMTIILPQKVKDEIDEENKHPIKCLGLRKIINEKLIKESPDIKGWEYISILTRHQKECAKCADDPYISFVIKNLIFH